MYSPLNCENNARLLELHPTTPNRPKTTNDKCRVCQPVDLWEQSTSKVRQHIYVHGKGGAEGHKVSISVHEEEGAEQKLNKNYKKIHGKRF